MQVEQTHEVKIKKVDRMLKVGTIRGAEGQER